jgi:hypothetical protein
MDFDTDNSNDWSMHVAQMFEEKWTILIDIEISRKAGDVTIISRVTD